MRSAFFVAAVVLVGSVAGAQVQGSDGITLPIHRW